MKLAFASNDGSFVAQHFGNARKFIVLNIAEDTGEWGKVEIRESPAPCEFGDSGGHNHDDEKFAQRIESVADCQVLFAAKIGNFAKSRLEIAGVQVLEKTGFIKEIVAEYVKYLHRPLFGNRNKNRSGNREHFGGTKRRDVIDDHPCFSAKAHNAKGRLHLPVSPLCNIQCRFCSRSQNRNENRPGVAAGVLKPEEAVATVKRALELCPEISVVGIAGPGDTLATDHAIETFRNVHAVYPHLIKCLSTNGLELPSKARVLWDVGVKTITVTVNAVAPEILQKIVAWIKDDRDLTAAQLAGIRECAEIGMTVKINTVLIPGVNDAHVEEIARAVKNAGAKRHNIIPLIPQNEFANATPPSCEQIEQARQAAGLHLEQFRHCRHCRADACGIPGVSDLSKELYQNRELETFSHG